MRGHMRLWDRQLHAWVGALPSSPVDRWMRRLSVTADHGKLWLAVAALLATRPGTLRRAAVRGVAAQGLSSLLVNAVLKQQFGRVRPDFANLQTHRKLRRAPGSLSFPSGHSSSAAAFATGVALEAPIAGTALAPLALGVGYSRVHVGVHYPGDVAAGLAIGTAVALATASFGRRRPDDDQSHDHRAHDHRTRDHRAHDHRPQDHRARSNQDDASSPSDLWR